MEQLRQARQSFHQNVEDVAKAIVVHAIASDQWHGRNIRGATGRARSQKFAKGILTRG